MNWELRIKIEDEDPDLVEALAQGAANRLGHDVCLLLLRGDGDAVAVSTYSPRQAK